MKNSHIKTIIATSLIIGSLGANAQTNEIYRYKDRDGKIIYTDKLPKNKSVEVGVLSKNTGVLKNLTELEAARVVQQLTEEEKEQLASAKAKESEQLKKDQYLLNTYSNVQEINKIKRYELDQIDRVMQSDKISISSMQERKTQIENLIKSSSKPNTRNGFEEELSNIDEGIKKANESLERNKNIYAEREQKYNSEIERFTAVVNMINKEKALKSEINQ